MTTTGGASHTHFAPLSEDRCQELLGQHTVGRVGLEAPDGPLILPVNYRYWTGRVVFRTSPYGPLAALVRRTPVAFEIDGIDESSTCGWSVLVRGTTAAVTTDHELGELWRTGPQPWAEGTRNLLITVESRTITGRLVRGPFSG